MKVLKLVSLLAAVAVSVLAQLEMESDDGVDHGNERPRVLCGRVLADARMLYCYANADPQKRSTSAGLIAQLHQLPRSHDPTWRWMTESRALALRGKRDPGLADECCLKACYISELLNYC